MKNTKPSIRFAGFTDDWEERKLGDIYDFSKGKGLPLDSFTMSKISPAIAYGHLYTHYSEVISEVLLSSDDQGVMSKSNDLLFPGSSTVPNGTAQANAITLNNVKLGGDIIIGRPKKDSNVMSTFMSYQINSQREKLFPITVGSTISHMYGKDLANLTFLTTSLEEQGRISQLFYQLDNTIVLHQRQLDLLKEQKKGYLQKMFPKNGAKVPELRFAGFADDWEERKLGDISYKVKEKNKTGEFTETLTNSAEYGIINQRDFFDKDISNAKNLTGYYVVKNDDFVYNPRISNFAPVGPIKRNKLGRTGVMSPLYYVFRTHDIDKNYFEKYFDTVYWHRFMELNGDSGARADRFAIKDSVFVEMPIPYPTMDEQQKIGSFFKQLDDTIALHQRKLDLLKEQKKGLLQKMFVYY